jgi:NTE family protein
VSDLGKADLVLEGGGVKGIALVGAFSILEAAGVQVQRVAGTSAGAIVGAMIAADYSALEMKTIMNDLDYNDFEDKTMWDELGALGKAISIFFEHGEYKGDFAHHWIAEQLEAKQKTTFSTLTHPDPGSSLPPEEQYRLVVMASDISAGRLRRLPWDYGVYGDDPAEVPIADAVRASMSIPFFFKPVIKDVKGGGKAWLVDGGMLSDFPITTFDRTDGKQSRWPTIGLKLSARATSSQESANPISGTFSMAKAMLGTMTGFYDQMHLDDPATIARTIFIDTTGVQATDFDLDQATKDRLFASGQAAATKFLDGGDGQPAWDWDAYQKNHPPRPADQ